MGIGTLIFNYVTCNADISSTVMAISGIYNAIVTEIKNYNEENAVKESDFNATLNNKINEEKLLEQTLK
jgi:hypothetical protein